MPTAPLLSIVIPTRNRRDMLFQAVQSVLQQPLPFSFECIVSDNASDDSTPGVAAAFPEVKYIRRPELIPMWDHWNLCAREARGKYVKMLCDDDWLIAGALEREVLALNLDPTLTAAVSARYEVCPPSDAVISLKRFSSSRRRLGGARLQFAMLLGENILGPPSNLTFLRECFLGYPEGYLYARDWAAWIQLADQGNILFLPEPGCNFRVHPASLTSGHVAAGNDFLDVQALRRECLRRLPASARPVGWLIFAWIWCYRLLRRIARFVHRGELRELAAFFGRIASYRPPVLPLGSAKEA